MGGVTSPISAWIRCITREDVVPLIAITASSEEDAREYEAAIRRRGSEVRLLMPGGSFNLTKSLAGVDGVLLSGGPDIHPGRYGQRVEPTAHVESDLLRDELEFAVLQQALAVDMPVLGICRGMQLLNVIMGGSLLQDIPGHQSVSHQVFVSPGSKLGTIIGSGGYFRTNSRHHQGLRDAQRSHLLLASAYMPDDGIIEALESPAHEWVIGVQCHPENEEEVARGLLGLFDGLIQQAHRYSELASA